MQNRYKAQSPAFILHRREYGESSRILICFTRDFGRVDILCKGCRKAGKANRVLEPFRRYQLSWSGKSELKTLVQSDEHSMHNLHHGSQRLYCGLYLNELLNGLVRPAESEPDLFDLYEQTLQGLGDEQGSPVNYLLRYFELNMLHYMGYGVSLEYEQDGTTPIDAACGYGFEPEQGFFRTASEQHFLAQGDSIIALNAGSLNSSRQEKEARNLTRRLIGYYLPHTRIQSRKLFVT
jgi:DNA repair protein RecO (recombination protein O)